MSKKRKKVAIFSDKNWGDTLSCSPGDTSPSDATVCVYTSDMVGWTSASWHVSDGARAEHVYMLMRSGGSLERGVLINQLTCSAQQTHACARR